MTPPEKDIQARIGFTLFASAYAVTLVLAWLLGADWDARLSNLLVCMLGTAAGCLLGFLTTPFTNEATSFLSITKALWAFISGYVLSKVDGILAFVGARKLMDSTLFTHRLELFAITLIFCSLMVYMFRRYLTRDKPGLTEFTPTPGGEQSTKIEV